MGRLLVRSLGLAATVGAIVTSPALAAPVNLTRFSVSPSCARPGGTVTGTVTVQNSNLLPQTFYGQTRTSYYGYQVQTSQVYGPFELLPLQSITTSMQMNVPWYSPWGSYTVTAGVGPSSSDAMSWSTAQASVTVVPWC